MLLTIDVPAVSFVHGLALPADANVRRFLGKDGRAGSERARAV
ncbi:MAG: hypothetical protein ACK6CT_01930 [Planctomycetia bacterium]|jgi:hypothetical protein